MEPGLLTSPTFLQWTVRFRRSVRGHAVVGSKRPETIWAVTAVGGIDAYFLTLTHAHNAALPAEQIEHPPVYMRRRSELFSVRYVGGFCRRVESRCVEASIDRSPRYLRGAKPRAPNLPEDHDVARAVLCALESKEALYRSAAYVEDRNALDPGPTSSRDPERRLP
jgi:hypothetical protein